MPFCVFDSASTATTNVNAIKRATKRVSWLFICLFSGFFDREAKISSSHWLRFNADALVQLCRFIDVSVFDDQPSMSNVAYVLRRIAIDQDEIRKFARGYR